MNAKPPLPAMELSGRKWLTCLLALVLVRLAISSLLLFDIPHLPSHDGWYFRHGGDADLYVELSQAILSGHLKSTTVGVGLPLLMAGLSRITGGQSYYDSLPWLVPMNGFLFAGLSVWLVGQTALYLTGGRHQALFAAALWVMSGYVLWLGLGLHPDAGNLRDAYLPRQLWMNGLTDPPSLFLALLGIALTARAYLEPGNYRWLNYTLAGLSFGLGSVARIHTITFAATALAALLWNRQWRATACVTIGSVAGFAPQLWYNAVTSPSALNTPYLSGWLGFTPGGQFYFRWNAMPISPSFVRDSLVVLTQGNWAVFVAELALVGFVLYAFVRCWQLRGSFAALVMFGAPVLNLALHVATFVFATDPIRFSLPAITVGFPAAAWVADTARASARNLAGRFQLRHVPAES